MPFFREMIGQARPISMLQVILKRDEIPQSLLFVGEAGIGKRTTAALFAQTLFCKARGMPKGVAGSIEPHEGREPREGRGPYEGCEPCQRCLACQKMQSGNHPDFYVIAPEPEESEIKIDRIRHLQEEIIFSPIDGEKKVILIDGELNLAAANSLLKTLEEPPPYAIMILIATSAEALPPTILSRCQKIVFHALGPTHLEALLMEKKGWTSSEARRVVVLTGGNLGQALLLDLPTAIEKEETLHAMVSDRTLSHYEAIFEVAAQFSRGEETLNVALYYLLLWFRDVLVFQSIKNPEYLLPSCLLNPDRFREIQAWAHRMSPHQVERVIAYLQEIQRGEARNINRQLALEALFIQLREGVAVSESAL